MLRIRDEIAGESITFHYVQSKVDALEFGDWLLAHSTLGIDTESTGLNCYAPGWKLRTVQCGDAYDSYVIPARRRNFIAWIMTLPINWIGHNGPHDIRCIDQYLGYETGVVCAGETYIPAHHMDSRGPQEGGTGHGLKELSIAHIDREAGKWETALKAEFKNILIPMPGEVYKSGRRKGEPKTRKARLSEGWSLIDPEHPAYIAYAASDPLLTYRLYGTLQPSIREFTSLYHFDKRVQHACDRLTRRAIKLDVGYTRRLDAEYLRRAREMIDKAAQYGLMNIHSGQQIAECLTRYGARLTEYTPTGQLKTDDHVLRRLLAEAIEERKAGVDESCLYREEIIRAILVAKQLLKRRESYTESMLSEMDAEGRIHPSINSLGARTARMSVSRPPLQQLPTKDREDEL